MNFDLSTRTASFSLSESDQHTSYTFPIRHYYQKTHRLHSTQADLLLQVRTVPGQTLKA